MPDAITEQQARQIGEWRNIRYRSWPSGRDYSFTYTLVSGSWRVHIDNSPDYGNRPSDDVATHRIDIGRRPYICWDQAINTLSEAQAVSALWADCTERYIATGRFEPPPGRPTPSDRSVLNGFTPRQASAPRAPAVPPPSAGAQRDAQSLRQYEQNGLWLWAAGLIAFTLFCPIWVACMHNGVGIWDAVWGTVAGVGALLAITSAEMHPGGRGWPMAYGISGAILGVASLTGGTPGALWALAGFLAVANAVQYAYATYRFRTAS